MRRGFTLIEVLMVLAVIAILATLAMPSLRDRIVRDQIVEAMKLADVAKPNVAAIWSSRTRCRPTTPPPRCRRPTASSATSSRR